MAKEIELEKCNFRMYRRTNRHTQYI